MGSIILLRDEPLDDDATVITAPPVDPDATVIVAIEPEPTAPTAIGRPAFADLFAEPPHLPPKLEAPAPVRRWTRRRRLMLVAVIVVGAWVTLKNAARRAPRGPTSGVIAVRAAAADPAPVAVVPDGAATPTSAPVRPVDGAHALAAGRLDDALPRYLRLAADHPDDPAYGVLAEILIRDLDERCRTERSIPCTSAPSPR